MTYVVKEVARRCSREDCLAPATHAVYGPNWSAYGDFCEGHARERADMLNRYQDVVMGAYREGSSDA